MKMSGFNNNTTDNYTQMALSCKLVSLISQSVEDQVFKGNWC